MAEKRLIDAKVFAEHLERMARTAYPNLLPGLFEAAEYAKDFPTVDSVEVVRCKDCAKDGLFTCPICFIENKTLHFINHSPDFYCGEGERKDGEGNG